MNFGSKIVVLALALCSVSGFASETSNTELVQRIYLDLIGRRASASELTFAQQLDAATSASEKRRLLKNLLVNDLLKKQSFETKLLNYFNGLFSASDKYGELAPLCRDSMTEDCVPRKLARDFRDEPAMFLTRLITEGMPEDTATTNETVQNFDIRQALTSTKTLMNPAMARTLFENQSWLARVGLNNIDKPRLEEISVFEDSENWQWIDRDPQNEGVVTGNIAHREKHAGVLTTPAYLLRSGSHLSRAYNFRQWFMCKSLSQSPVPQNNEVKLEKRTPCSGCHSILEPLGSYWVHWRAKIDTDLITQGYVLDGQIRKDPETGVKLPEDGTIPVDVDDPDAAHSRRISGTFRGHVGTGVRRLAEIAVNEADFAKCMTTHAWQVLFARKLSSEESGWAEILGQKLKSDYNWDLREILVDIVLGSSYSGEDQP